MTGQDRLRQESRVRTNHTGKMENPFGQDRVAGVPSLTRSKEKHFLRKVVRPVCDLCPGCFVLRTIKMKKEKPTGSDKLFFWFLVTDTTKIH